MSDRDPRVVDEDHDTATIEAAGGLAREMAGAPTPVSLYVEPWVRAALEAHGLTNPCTSCGAPAGQPCVDPDVPPFHTGRTLPGLERVEAAIGRERARRQAAFQLDWWARHPDALTLAEHLRPEHVARVRADAEVPAL